MSQIVEAAVSIGARWQDLGSGSDRERAKTSPARHLPHHPLRLQRPQQRRPGLRRDPECPGERLRRQHGCAQQRLDRIGQPRPLVDGGSEPPALLGGGLEPVELAQSGAGALGDQVEKRERPGDRPVAAEQTIGGIAAQARQVVAIAEADGGIGRPDGEEHRAGDAGAGEQAGRGEQRLGGRRGLGDAGLHPALRRMRRKQQRRPGRIASLPSPHAVSAAPDVRLRRVRRPPGGECLLVQPASAERGERLGGFGRAGERGSAGVFRLASQQPGECQCRGDRAVTLGHRLERRIGPAGMLGGAGEGLRQGAVTGTDRGERRGSGEPERRAARDRADATQAWAWASQPAASAKAMRAMSPSRTAVGAAAAARASSRASTSVAAQSGPSSARRSASGSQASGLLRWVADGRRPARAVAAVGVGFILGVLPGGRSTLSSSSSGSVKPLSAGMAAFPQAIDLLGPAWLIRANSVQIGS